MLTVMAHPIATIPNRLRPGAGYTAIESMILLVVLAALAMTSLAVYQKLETAGDAAAQTPTVQIPNPQEPADHSSTESTSVQSSKANR